jgi:hypothetical protein
MLVEKVLYKEHLEVVKRAKCILEENSEQVFDFIGIIKGFIALEDLGLYNMEENVDRATSKIDLGIELYDMETRTQGFLNGK